MENIEETPINDTNIEKEPETTPVSIILEHIHDNDAVMKSLLEIIIKHHISEEDTKEFLNIVCDMLYDKIFSKEEAEVLIEHIHTLTLQLEPISIPTAPSPYQPYQPYINPEPMSVQVWYQTTTVGVPVEYNLVK